jgi:hypothetical protein
MSPDSISLQAANGESRTYPMSQVGSVQYDQPPANAEGQATNAPPSAPPAQAGAPVPQPVDAGARQTSASNAPPQAPPQAPPPPAEVFQTIPAGATIAVRNNETIDSQTAEVGQTFSGVIEQDVLDDNGKMAIPRGSNATLVVRSASGQGKLQGQSDLAVDVGGVDVAGRHYRIDTSDFAERGKQGVGTNKRTGIFAGGGAALGGLIGALAGGGKGAAIGALTGAGAGTATQALTRGKAVRIPSETLLRFKLENPVQIRATN